MAYLLDPNSPSTNPPDTEPFRLGAQRIRELKDALQGLLGKIFNNDGTWVTGDGTKGFPGTALKNASVDSTKLTTLLGVSPGVVFDCFRVDTAGRIIAAQNAPDQVGPGILDGAGCAIDTSLGTLFTYGVCGAQNTTVALQNFWVNGQCIQVYVDYVSNGFTFNFTGVNWFGSAPAIISDTTRHDLFTFMVLNGGVYGSYVTNFH